MTGAELVAAVAKRLGLVKCKSDAEIMRDVWKYPNGDLETARDFLTSIDAARGLLEPGEYLSMIKFDTGQDWYVHYKVSGEVFQNESLPHAILQAFLDCK